MQTKFSAYLDCNELITPYAFILTIFSGLKYEERTIKIAESLQTILTYIMDIVLWLGNPCSEFSQYL